MAKSTNIGVFRYSLTSKQLFGTNVYKEGAVFKITVHLQFIPQSKVERAGFPFIGMNYSCFSTFKSNRDEYVLSQEVYYNTNEGVKIDILGISSTREYQFDRI